MVRIIFLYQWIVNYAFYGTIVLIKSSKHKHTNLFLKGPGMKKDFIRPSQITLSALIVSLVILPSCGVLDWIKSTFSTKEPAPSAQEETHPAAEAGFIEGLEVVNDGSPAVVTIEGKTVVTEKSLEKAFQQLLQEDPRVAQMIPLMGGEEVLKDRIVQALAEQKLMKRWAMDANLAQNAQFQSDRERMIDQIDYLLFDKYFKTNFKASVSDAEVKRFYEENKDKMPELLVSRGGVRAKGIKFESQEKAQEFLAKVNAAQQDLDKAAQEAGIAKDVQDFHVVNNQSVGLAPALRDKIMEIKKFPSVEVVKVDDKAFWVVKAMSKEETVYRKYDEIKDQIRGYLEGQKQEQMVSQEKDKLRKKYTLKVEKTFAQPGATEEESITIEPAQESRNKADAQDQGSPAPHATQAA